MFFSLNFHEWIEILQTGHHRFESERRQTTLEEMDFGSSKKSKKNSAPQVYTIRVQECFQETAEDARKWDRKLLIAAEKGDLAFYPVFIVSDGKPQHIDRIEWIEKDSLLGYYPITPWDEWRFIVRRFFPADVAFKIEVQDFTCIYNLNGDPVVPVMRIPTSIQVEGESICFFLKNDAPFSMMR